MKRKILIITLTIFLLPLLSACHYTRTSYSSKTIRTTISNKDFTSLRVNSIDSDIELRTAEHAHVAYKGPKNNQPTVSLKNNDILAINQSEVNKSTNFRWFPFGFSISNDSSTIIIYLPKKQLSSLKITSDDGDINGNVTINAHRIHLESDDGDINIDKVKAQSGSISSSDGDISLTHLITKSGFQILSDDGDIDVDYTNASGYKVTTDDGDLSVNGHDYDNKFYSKLNSKNVLVANSDDGDIELN